MAWILRHPVRSLLYAALAAAAAWVAFVFLRPGGVELTGIVNSSLAREFTGRLGVRYQVGSLRFGRLDPGWKFSVDARNMQVQLAGAGPVGFEVARLAASLGGSASLEAVRVNAGGQPELISIDTITTDAREARARGIAFRAGAPLLQLDELQASLADRATSLRGLRLLSPDGARAVLTVRETATSPLRLVQAGGSVTLDQVMVRGVSLLWEPGLWTRERLEPFSTAAPLVRLPQTATAVARKAVAQARGFLWWALLAATAALLVAKFLLTPRWHGLRRRAALAVVCAALPYILYPVPGIVPRVIAALAVAASLWFVFYRWGKEWHERWEPFAVDLLSPVLVLPLLTAYLYPVPPLEFPLPARLHVGAVEIRDIAAQVRDPRCGAPELASFTAPAAQARDIRVALDSAQLQSVEGAFSIRGTAETSALAAELRDLRLAPVALRRPLHIGLCADVTLNGPAAAAQCEPETGDVQAAMVGTVQVAPKEWNPTFAAESVVRSPVVQTHAVLEGDETHVTVKSLRTLPGSPLRIDGGSGAVRLSDRVRVAFTLGGLETRLRDAGLKLRQIGFQAALPQLCGSPDLKLHTSWDGIELRSAGYSSSIESLRLLAARNGAALNVVSGLTGVAVTGGGGWLAANFPGVELRVQGKTSGERLPRRVEGQATVSAAQPGGTAFHTAVPLSFAADLRRARLDLPRQRFEFEQAVATQLPRSVTGTVAMRADLESSTAELRAGIPRLKPDVLPAELEIQDLELLARAAWHGAAPSVSAEFGTGWNTIVPPAIPRAFELKEISELRLETAGKLSQPVLDRSLLDRIRSLNTSLPVAGPWQLRLRGEWRSQPGILNLEVEEKSGRGLRIAEIRPELKSLAIRDGRLGDVRSTIRVSGLRTSAGGGDLTAIVETTLAGNALDLTSQVPLAGGTPLRLRAHRTPERITVGAEQIDLDRLMPAIEPYLREFGLLPEGITVLGRLAGLAAETRFAGARLAGLEAAVRFLPGPLLTVKEPAFEASIRGGALDVRVGPAPVAAPQPATVALDLDGIEVRFPNGGIRSNFTARVAAALHSSGRLPETPVLARLAGIASRLDNHFDRATEVFGAPTSAPLDHITWQFSARNQDGPFLKLDPDRLALRCALDSGNLAVAIAGRAAPLTWDGSGALALNLGLHDDALIAGGHVSSAGSRLPFRIALTERVQPLATETGLLWSADYHTQFGKQHGGVPAPLFEMPRLTVGPLSIQQLSFPLGPLAGVLGVGDRLQFHFPFAARALFGEISGLAQADLAWRRDHAEVTSRFRLNVKNVEAGALGWYAAGFHTPFLDDRLDGEVRAGVDGLRLDPHTAAELAGELGRGNLLDRVSLDAAFFSSPDRVGPGLLQLSSDTRIDLLNEVLNRAIRNVQLWIPPAPLRYEKLRFRLRVDRGEVLREPVLLELNSLATTRPGLVPIESNIRVHWWKKRPDNPEDRFPLRGLVGLFESLAPALW